MKTRELPKVKLKKLTAEIAGKMTDAEFFTRKSFEVYLNQTLKAICTAKRSGRIRLKVFSADNGMTGCTDGNEVLLNVSAPFIAPLPTRNDKLYAIIGLMTHECGHILLTNFRKNEQILKEFDGGGIQGHPEVKRILDAKGTCFKRYALQEIRWFINLVEDDFIEYWLCIYFRGLPSRCLEYTREIAFEYTEKDFLQNFGQGSVYSDLTSYCLMQVQSDHRIDAQLISIDPDRWNALKGPFNQVMYLIKNYRKELRNAGQRVCILRNIISILLPLIAEEYDEKMDEKEQQEADQDSDGGEDGGNDGQESPESENEKDDGTDGSPDDNEAGNKTGNGKEEKNSQGNSGKEETREENAAGSGGMDKEKIEQEILDELEERLEELSRTLGDTVKKNMKNGSANDLVCSNADTELPDVEKTPEELAKGELEAMRTQEDEEEAEGMDSSRTFTVNRKVTVTDHMKQTYDEIAHEVSGISKKTVRMLNNVLRDRQLDGRLTGQLYGKRMDCRQAYRDDGRFFTKELVPEGAPKVAFAVLTDESGSMMGEKIEAARKATVCMEMVLRELGVPLCIMGHTADEGNHLDVTFNKYVEFDSFDKLDRYRLAGMRYRSNNHDALAIRFIGRKLLKRPESQKVLIVISDGQPNAINFTDGFAIRRTALEVAELEKKGVRVFAFALEGCYRQIVSIYGKDRTMDISDLSNLPGELTKLVKRYVVKR